MPSPAATSAQNQLETKGDCGLRAVAQPPMSPKPANPATPNRSPRRSATSPITAASRNDTTVMPSRRLPLPAVPRFSIDSSAAHPGM